jgi:hypothetical protein
MTHVVVDSRERERFQQRVNVQGELIPLLNGPAMSDAAWALENFVRAKQTLPAATADSLCSRPVRIPTRA